MNALQRYSRKLFLSAGFLTTALLAACGGGDQNRDPILGLSPSAMISVTVTPIAPSVAAGRTQQFAATATYGDGSTRDVTTASIWAASNNGAATINASSGLATSVAIGSSTMSASYKGLSGSGTLTVTAAVLDSMSLTPLAPVVAAGAAQQFFAIGTFSDGTTRNITAQSTFVSASPAVATIGANSGVAAGIGAGTSLITASSGGRSASTTMTVNGVVVTSLIMIPTSPSIAIGGAQQFTAIATFSDGSTRDVTSIATFSSSVGAVASIGAANGLAQGIAAGTTVISASSAGRTTTSTLTVTANTLSSIALSPASSTIGMGITQQYVVIGTFSDNSTRDITGVSSFSTSSSAVATINSEGLATGVAAGSTQITATTGGKTASRTLTVTPASLTSIVMEPNAPLVQIGATRQMIITATYADASAVDVTTSSSFASSAPAIATVNPSTGVVTGISSGTAVISASFANKVTSTTVTVPAVQLAMITVSPGNSSLNIGANQFFIATATYTDNSTANVTNSVTWSSDAIGVATILQNGMATGKAAGFASITAVSGSKSGNANLTVNAALPPPPAATLSLGTASTFGVLAGTSITNNSGGTTLVTGDVGSPSQTTDPVQAAGYANYKSGAILAGALGDLQIAITDARSRTCDVTSASGIDLGGLVFTPGVYCYAGPISITGTFTMNGPGLYIFRTASTLNTTANSIVALNGAASADSVFWVPVAPTTLGANSVFKGSVLAQVAAITMGDNASLTNGRVLSAAAVTLKNNKITK